MKIVVIGGTGLIGSRLVERLRESGHEPVAASPATGVDAVSGEGVRGVVAGAQVVVDVANAPVREDAAVLDFFRTSSRNLLSAEAEAEVEHHVALSVVGNDRLPDSGYLRAKAAQEQAVRAGSVPFTIVRATQFFEFVGYIADSATDGDTVRLPPALMCPVAADDVVATLAETATGPPVNGVVELGGPELIGMAELARRVLEANRDRRVVEPDPRARYFGAEVDDGSLNPAPDARTGAIRFDDWLAAARRGR